MPLIRQRISPTAQRQLTMIRNLQPAATLSQVRGIAVTLCFEALVAWIDSDPPPTRVERFHPRNVRKQHLLRV
jgi:hypothetical protein